VLESVVVIERDPFVLATVVVEERIKSLHLLEHSKSLVVEVDSVENTLRQTLQKGCVLCQSLTSFVHTIYVCYYCSLQLFQNSRNLFIHKSVCTSEVLNPLALQKLVLDEMLKLAGRVGNDRKRWCKQNRKE
jgi:hypothetical protein